MWHRDTGSDEPRELGRINDRLAALIAERTSARMVRVSARVERHYREHASEFDMARAEAMLPTMIADPRAVYVGRKLNSLVFVDDWDTAYLLAASIKALPGELWLETLYVTRTQRFLRRRWTQHGPLYVRLEKM
ncbi:MAG TPA: hypothetical protein VFI42_09730 [Thermomicrobiaceae bacterium]|nr:hypothetical protein [Thermomicrobiaceae bacterium]